MKNLVRIGLASCLMVAFSGCENVSVEKKDFLYKLDEINMNLEYMIGTKAQYDGSADTKEFPKTISYNKKEYALEYNKNKIIIKDFNEKELCNQGVEYYMKEDENKAIKRYRNIFVDCSSKDAVVIVADGLK